jgi:hypothetical protein
MVPVKKKAKKPASSAHTNANNLCLKGGRLLGEKTNTPSMNIRSNPPKIHDAHNFATRLLNSQAA